MTKLNSLSTAKQNQKNTNPFEVQWNKKTQGGSSSNKKKDRYAHRPSGRNRFHDQRVGEQNPVLTDEQRYIARLQRERSRGTKKRSRFNLSNMQTQDGEPEPNERTEEFPMHDPEAWKYFVLKGAKDDFNGELDVDPDAEEAGASTGNGAASQLESNVSAERLEMLAKSGAIMSEEEDEEEGRPKTHQEIMNEVMMKSKMYRAERRQSKAVDEVQREALDSALPELMSLLSESNAMKNTPVEDSAKANSAGFDYDTTLLSLEKERRGRATQRTKTEEEKEAEERERLEELENTRLTRMSNLPEDDSDEENRKEDKKAKENVVGDAKKMKSKSHAQPLKDIGDADKVPFVFDKCPSDLNELVELLTAFSPSLRGLVVERLMKCFAVSLDSSNSSKLQRLLALLLARIQSESLKTADVKVVSEEVEQLTNSLYALSVKYPSITIEWSRERLYESYSALKEKALSECWTTSNLFILRLISRLFPGSDVRHNVMTPLMLLVSEALSPRRLVGDRDVALGCFLCSILLEVTSSRNRASGQVVQFLAAFLQKYASDTPNESGDNKIVQPLVLSDCVDQDGNSSAELPIKLRAVLLKLTHASLFEYRMPSSDLMYAPLLQAFDEIGTSSTPGSLLESEARSALQASVQKHRTSRKPLTLYTEKSVKIPKSLNPKFTAVNGVYKKHDRHRPGVSTVQQTQDALKRIRKSLKKEQRGYARDLRREALASAQERAEEDSVRRAYSSSKSKELQLFLEDQQSTWNKAAKRQKMLSGTKW